MPVPFERYAVLEDVHAQVAAAFDATLPAPLLFARSGVIASPPNIEGWDDCSSHLVVWCEAVTPTDRFPAAPERPILCGIPPSKALQVVVQTIRCVPGLSDAGAFPEPADLDAAARLTLVDADVVWDALVCWATSNAMDLEAAMVGATVVPELGGVSGWETRMLIEVASCAPCGAPVEFPPGFLDGSL